jgi:MFS transporter, FHS family, L-fucose permease
MQKSKLVQAQTILPLILLTSCFAWWGLANNMTDTLLAAFKKIKSMSDFQTSLIQMAFFGAYFCFALPAALYITKFTYKSGVLLGLALFIIGGLLFYPASITMEYGHFLCALYILASGLSILETSANPYILVMGPPETATRRLNLAQSFNPIGSILGVVIGKIFILGNLHEISKEERLSMSPEILKNVQSQELAAVMTPYVTVSFILMMVWIAIAISKMPKESDSSHITVLKSFKRLSANRNYVFSVVAQFFYVGAQVGIWSFTIRYVMEELKLDENNSATYFLASIILFSVSRFICTALMKYIRPIKLLASFALAAGILCLVVIGTEGLTGVIALISISACMSLMFPTIYGIALEGVGEDMKIGGAGLIMAILGGAILTAVQGIVSDSFGIHIAFIVPLVSFTVILLFALYRMGIVTVSKEVIQQDLVKN